MRIVFTEKLYMQTSLPNMQLFIQDIVLKNCNEMLASICVYILGNILDYSTSFQVTACPWNFEPRLYNFSFVFVYAFMSCLYGTLL